MWLVSWRSEKPERGEARALRNEQVPIIRFVTVVWVCFMGLRVWGGQDNSLVVEELLAQPLLAHPLSDTRIAQSDRTITILAQQLDATGAVISERMVPVRRIYDRDSGPGSVGHRGQGPSPRPIQSEVFPAHLPVVLYDNTVDEFAWYDPKPLRHVEDFGLSSGGQVTSFNFGYVTADFLPVSLSIRFYSGTDLQTCPGTFLGGWIFSGLDGSLFGWPEQISYAFEIPLGEEFVLPAGALGYSYEFANYDTGVWLARGGNGNEDHLWINCRLGSFSSAWAGTYMKIFGFSEAKGICLDPPAFDSILSPLEIWQMTRPVNLKPNACRIYQLNLNTNAGYDFSLCFSDGVGSFSFGDGDLEMFDATGTSLWYIDGASSCDWAASTLGTVFQEWRPTASGIYYLKVSEFFDDNLIFNLAYKATVLADPNIYVVPGTLELSCSTGSNTSTSEAVQNESIVISDFLNTMVNSDKLIWSDRIFSQFRSPSKVARVIVHLKEPADWRENLDWNSKSSREAFRGAIDRRQLEILKRLKQSEVNVKIRFKNLCAFSAEVSSRGLDKLVNDPLVIAIEPVIQIKAHLRQGIALMNALTPRQSHSGAGMAIAIVDTGIDYNHPMLGGGGFPNSKVIGGFDFGDNDSDPMAGLSHGTNVAGIAAGDLGEVGDYIGGVAPDAKLYALKITAGFGGIADTDDLVAAWDWCVTHQYADPNNPIMVINTSFGGNQFFSSCDSVLPSMTLAADNAVAAGITVLASTGNEGWCDSLAWPACISNVISVGAVYDAAFGSNSWCVSGLSCANIFSTGGCSTGWAATDTSVADKITVYSNTASFLDILAPSNRAYTTDLSGGYTTSFGGTSAACPYAAGIVACLQSAARDMNGAFLTPSEVRQFLIDSGDPITDSKIAITKPRINLENAISASACTGMRFTIQNNGGLSLEVSSINGPDWVTLNPSPPFSIAGGSRIGICVEVDCSNCGEEGMSGSLEIASNDPAQGTVLIPITVIGPCIASCTVAGDLNQDCITNLLDFSLFSQMWLNTECNDPLECNNADINASGTVDMADFSLFIQGWLGSESN